jgi:hypothetical protein
MPKPQNSRITIPCARCGKHFSVYRCWLKGGRRKFCSISCRNASQVGAVERECERCGKKFSVVPSKVAKGQGKFCSRACAYGTPAARFADGATSPPTARGCIEWSGQRDKDGYGQLWDGRRMMRAHRFAWEQVHGPIPESTLVCHDCDNPPCVNVAHMFLGTHGDNHADRNEKGRQAKGEKIGPAKLSPDAVKQIRELRRAGLSQQRIADRFGVCQTTVSSVLLGKNWSHVRGQ